MSSAPTEPKILASDSERGDGLLFLAVLLCFFLSGFAALVYQTAWLRQFSVVFGTSELAVATVLAAYMAGLALGAALAGRVLPHVKRPILWYGALEAGVALGALLVPVGLSFARFLQASLIGEQGELVSSGGAAQSAFYLVTTFLVVLVPTTCMGATLPLLTRHAVRRRDHIGPRVGLLYTTNTAGAVVGTLAGAFMFLPQLGLAGTVYVGVGANLVVFILAAALSRLAPPPVPPSTEAMDERSAKREVVPDKQARWILPLIAISGAVSFTYEVLWTRLLSHVLGGSVYAFAAMLASFLTGIAIGGAAASLLARSRRSSALGFALSQLGIAALSAWVYTRMDTLPARYLEGMAEAGASPQGVGTNLAFALLLPATILIGATFPFALRVLARSRSGAGRASARVYSWNTVGAIVGALLTGFVLIPNLGFAGTARLAVGASLSLAAATAMLLLWPAWKPLCVGICAGLGGLLLFQPQPPLNLLRHAPLEPVHGADGEVLFTAVGQSATVLVLNRDGVLEVRSNGLPEAGILPEGTPPFGRNPERYLTALPVLARPAATSMLVIGFGGGVALESIPPTISDLDVVELEPEIITANRHLAPMRDVDPFDDPRLNLILNDARGALALTNKRWDIIVSQPSHPWTAGASHLYTQEFAQLCREHLTPGGVFVQWINAGFLDPTLFASVGATLLDTYEHVRLYRPVPLMLMFLASDSDLEVERDLVRTGAPVVQNPEYWSATGVSDVNELLPFLALEQEGIEALCAQGTVSTDDRNVLAMASRSDLVGSLNMESIWELLAAQDPLLASNSTLLDDLGDAVVPFDVLRGMMWALPLRANGLPERFKQVTGGDVGMFLSVAPALPGAGRRTPGSEGIRGAAETWTGEGALVWEGWKRAGTGRWSELQTMDADLAKISPSTPWFSHAMRLRAHWRLALHSTEPAVAREAIELLDRALVREPTPELLLLRLEAAHLAQWPAGILGTLGELLAWLGPGREALSAPQIAELEGGLRPWTARLETLGRELEGDSGSRLGDRLGELRARLDELLPPVVAPKVDDPGQAFR